MGKYPYFPKVNSTWNKEQTFDGITIKEVTTPSENPPANYMKLYFKADGKLYKLNSSGAETVSNSTVSAITQALLDAKANINNPTFTGVVTIPNISNLETAVTANTAKVGITTAQANAITANTAKTGITSGQASAITANTAKTGITSGQASAIVANTAKTGITSGQASAITANTAKTGITSGQASAITANTAKISLTDNSVTLAKLAHGTANKVLGFNGSGVPSEITVGGGSQFQEITSLTTFSPTIQTGLIKVNIDTTDMTGGIINLKVNGTTIEAITESKFRVLNPTSALALQSIDGNIGLTTYTGQDYQTSNNDGNAVTDLFMKPDGTKVFFCYNDEDKIIQFTLSTPFDITTATGGGSYNEFSVNSQESDPTIVTLSPDGTKMYVMGHSQDTIFQYTLSTAWNVATASYASKSLATGSQSGIQRSMFWKPDGLKLYVLGYGAEVYQYNLTTAFDVSTGSYAGNSYRYTGIASQENDTTALAFSADGKMMLAAGNQHNTIFQYVLSTAWNPATASYSGHNFSVVSPMTSIRNMSLIGSRLYAIRNSWGNNHVHHFTTILGFDGTARISVG